MIMHPFSRILSDLGPASRMVLSLQDAPASPPETITMKAAIARCEILRKLLSPESSG